MTLRKNITKIVSLFLTIALLIFAYRYISGIIGEIDSSKINPNWLMITLSGVFFILFYIVLSEHWKVACQVVEGKSNGLQRLAFFASQPYKYMPTSLFTFSYRALYAKRLGMGIKMSSIAQLIENFSMLCASFLVAAICYLVPQNPMLIFALVILTGSAAYMLNRSKEVSLSIKGRMITVPGRKLGAMFMLAVLGWVVGGGSFIFLNIGLGLHVSIADFISANSLAFAFSLLAFFAPGGIGIRELVYNNFGINPAGIVYWRILTFALDFAVGIYAILWIRRQRQINQDTEGA